MRRRRASSSSSSSVPGVVGRAMPRDVLARAASLTVEDVENEDARLNFSGALSATDAGGVCVLEGMRSAAPAGAILTFESGTRAVLLSHREPKTFGLMYDVDSSGRKVIRDAANAVAPGERCEASKVEFMLGPSAGSTLGKVVDALGEIVGSNVAMVTGTVDSSRIMREPPSVEDRKPITTPLVTGIKAVDLLAPVGRGQCMLVSGEPGTGLSELGLTSIAAQKNTGVRCVYAALGAQASRVNEVTKRLEADGAMAHTTIVTCNTKASEGERYAATCTAFAIAEGARATGQDVLLVLDDFTGLVNFTTDMSRMAPQLNVPEGTQEQMEEYEGMLISASLAERRRFLGMTLQRIARLNDKLKGGSITLMGVMYHPKGAYKKTFKSGIEGAGAGGAVLPSSVDSIAGFADMPPAIQEKLRKALEAKAAAAAAKTASEGEIPESKFVQSRPMVEEFMSITDGQVFVDSYDPQEGWIISAKDSVSRIGAPGAAGPFRSLNFLQLRLDLMQSDDMGTFGCAGDEKIKLRTRSEAIRGFLKQKQGDVSTLAEQTIGLFAIQKGYTKNKTADEVEQLLAKATQRANETLGEEMKYINENQSKELSADTMAKFAALFDSIA
jgi:F0F1-type ATP synthase alpha subunit